MRPNIRGAVLVAFAAATVQSARAADEPAPIPKEGSYTATTIGSATSKVLQLGKDRVQMAWESIGVQQADDPKGLAHNASFRCIGSLRAINAEYESFTNSCVITRPDGDQFFWVENGTGRLGGESRGSGSIVGGTGKLAGITGSGEWSRRVVRPAAEGTFQTVTRSKVAYRLP